MRRRLLLTHLALVAGLLLLLEVPLALIYSRHEHDSLDAALQRDAASVAAYAATTDVSAIDTFAAQLRTSGELIVATDASGTELTSPGILSSDPEAQRVLTAARARPVTGEVEGLVYWAEPTRPGGAVLVARPDDEIDGRVHRAWILLAVGGLALLGIAALLSNRLSRWLTEPLRRLDITAEKLGRGELDVRADASSGPAEVVALATTLNQMAQQLDELLRSQRRFVAEASHQLRTPLTALRLRVEGLDAGEGRDAALAELSRLSRIVDGLLALARAEGSRPIRVEVDVDAALAERCAAWAPLAEEHGIDLVLGAPGAGRAQLVEGHLEQMLDNLIDNALEACPPGGHVVVRGARANGHVEVHVADDGPGMTAPDRVHAFDPFWRGPDNAGRGTGLGLAIVDQLARASGGHASLDAGEQGGVDACLTFEAIR